MSKTSTHYLKSGKVYTGPIYVFQTNKQKLSLVKYIHDSSILQRAILRLSPLMFNYLLIRIIGFHQALVAHVSHQIRNAWHTTIVGILLVSDAIV